jgi:hypothetical protein
MLTRSPHEMRGRLLPKGWRVVLHFRPSVNPPLRRFCVSSTRQIASADGGTLSFDAHH